MICATLILIRKIITNALRVLVNNSFKKKIYGKKKVINVLTVFFISHKMVSKLS